MGHEGSVYRSKKGRGGVGPRQGAKDPLPVKGVREKNTGSGGKSSCLDTMGGRGLGKDGGERRENLKSALKGRVRKKTAPGSRERKPCRGVDCTHRWRGGREKPIAVSQRKEVGVRKLGKQPWENAPKVWLPVLGNWLG